MKDQIVNRLVDKKKDELYKDFITDQKSKVDVITNFEYLKELYVDTIQTTQYVVPDSI